MSSPTFSDPPVVSPTPFDTLPPGPPPQGPPPPPGPGHKTSMDTLNLIIALAVIFSLAVCVFIASLWLSRRRLFTEAGQSTTEFFRFAWWTNSPLSSQDVESRLTDSGLMLGRGGSDRRGAERNGRKRKMKQQKPILWDTVATPYYYDMKTSTDDDGYWEGIIVRRFLLLPLVHRLLMIL